MTVQANGAASPTTAKLGLRAIGSQIASAKRSSGLGPAARLRPEKRGTISGLLLSTALVASAATPLLAAAGVADIFVAIPLFLAGTAVAGASWTHRRTAGEAASSDETVNAATSGETALPLADIFDVPAFVVTPAGRIVGQNEAATTIRRRLGQRAEPPVLFDLLAPASRAQAMAALKMQDGKPIEARLNDGETRRLHILGGEGGGNMLAVLGAEAETAQTPGARPGALSDAMLATVSHELRTPLNAIIGFSAILENELFGKLGTDRQREYVGLIQSSGRHLLAVVNGILDVSKIEAGAYELQCEHFLLDEIVEEAAAMVRCQSAEKAVALVIDAPAGGTLIHGDRRALYQSLVNLLANAVKFTEEGEVRIGWQSRDRNLELTVEDTGIGIPADQIGRLGKPFVQASCGPTRRYEGTGLGLAYVRGMCELHGGDMRIASVEGEGTRVVLDMPLVPRRAVNLEDQNIVALNHVRDPKRPVVRPLSSRRTA